MKREDLEKLLGGYAAGTLNAEERRALFDASLTDQSIFDALANEEPLRDALADPPTRARVLAALEDAPRPRTAWWRQPLPWAGAGVLATAAVVGVILFRAAPQHPAPAETPQVAMVRTPAPPEIAANQPEPAPVPQKATKVRERGFVPPPAAPPEKKELPAPEEALAKHAPATDAAQFTAGAPVLEAPAAAPAPPPPPSPAAATSEAVAGAPIAPGAKRLFYTAFAETPPRADLSLGRQAIGGALTVPKSKAPAPAAAFGLRCSLVGQHGNEIPLNTPLDPSEPVRLRLEANERGYVYVLAGAGVLWSGPVLAAKPVFVTPHSGALDVVLLREPDPGPPDTLLSRCRTRSPSAALHTEENLAAYFVQPAAGADACVLAPVHLKFR